MPESHDMKKFLSKFLNRFHWFSWARVIGYDFFVSFKLGNFPSGTQNYASDLASKLSELGFKVFFSEEEAPPGEQLNATLIDALHKSRILVVIVNEAALLHSTWIRKEVEEFRDKHPQRPIIPININYALENFELQANVNSWLDHEKRIWLNETNIAAETGIVSKDVINRLKLTPRFIKARTRIRMITVIVFLSLCGISLLATYNSLVADKRYEDSLSRELARISLMQRDKGNSKLALPLAIEAEKTAQTQESLKALISETSRIPSVSLTIRSENEFVDAAFSEDSKRVVTLADGKDGDSIVQVWDVTTGALISQNFILGDKYESYYRQLSANGEHIVRINNEIHEIWNLITGQQETLKFNFSNQKCNQVNFSSDNQQILYNCDRGLILIFDSLTGQLRTNFFVSQEKFLDSKKKLTERIAGIQRRSVILGQREQDLQETEQKIINLQDQIEEEKKISYETKFSLDGKWILVLGYGNSNETGSHRRARIWSAETGKPLTDWLLFDSSDDTTQFSPTGKKLFVENREDNTVQIWDPFEGKLIASSSKFLHEDTLDIFSLFFSHDEQKVFTEDFADNIRIWDIHTGTVLTLPGQHEENRISSGISYPCDAVFTKDDKRVALVCHNYARVWDVRTGEPLTPVMYHENRITKFLFSHDEEWILTTSEDKTARIWISNYEQPLKIFPNHTRTITSVALSADNKKLVTGTWNGAVQIWDVETEEPTALPFYHSERILKLSFSPDNRYIVVSSNDSIVRVLDAYSAKSISEPLKHPSRILYVAFSKDENHIITISSDRIVRTWNFINSVLAKAEEIKEWKLNYNTLDININQHKIITSGEYNSSIRDLRTDLPLTDAPLVEDMFNAAAFSWNGDFLITARFREVKIWNVETGQLIMPPLLHDSFVESVAFSPDGKLIITGGSDKIVRIWKCQLCYSREQLLFFGQKNIVRPLNMNEQLRFLHK